MAWDSSRPVPWRRLIREWIIYVSIMAAIFVLVFRDRPLLGVFVGLAISGPLYLGIGYVLAKFGYQRKSLRELRAESRSAAARPEREVAGPKPRAAPTKRTGGHSTRPGRPGGPRRGKR